MSNQVLYIGSAYHLASRLEQLVLEPKDQGKLRVTRPAENLIFVELDHPQITLTLSALQLLAQKGAVVLITDDKHLPCSIITPVQGHSLQGKHQMAQWENQTKMSSWLWAQVVESKIAQQRRQLKQLGITIPRLERLQVLMSDRGNAEAQASRLYFPAIFGPDFLRHEEGDCPNNYLNYGYTVVRAMMARALVLAGLQTSPGIFHRNQYNAFPLADDMMEPYRPYVDKTVAEIVKKGKLNQTLEKSDKETLLSVIHLEVKMEGKSRPLHQAIHQTATSLAHCYLKHSNKLNLPDP